MQHSYHERLLEGHDLNILYVEDNDFARESTLTLLTIFFENIDVATNGEEGLEKYKAFYDTHQRYYDIVLTDINMPKISGIEMIREIRKLHERQDIIVISAHSESEYLIELIDLEINHFILKPIDVERFQKVFAHVIEIIMQKRAYRSMNEHLQYAKQMAEEATEQKSRFLANMSHEIRTPLNAITGFIALLDEKETDETKRNYLKIIKNASDSLLQIINDILDISKIESGKLMIEPCNFDPYEHLIPLAELFQAKAKEKKIDFRLKFDQGIPTLLNADILRIKQIFSNLLSNAVKFTPEGKTIESVISYKNGKLNIMVKDHGIGICEEKQQSIFEPFSQADSSTERVFGGTGLGLAISLELSRMLGGNLTLNSKKGKGSTFTLSVPAPIGHYTHAKEEEEEVTLSGHILIVEDHEANRVLLGIILENAGLTFETANDGLEAIEKFKEGQYDLIIMDENMPNMGGMDAAKEIFAIEQENRLPHTPIISLTANAMREDRKRFLDAGFDDYLSKPVDPPSLLKMIAKRIKSRGEA